MAAGQRVRRVGIAGAGWVTQYHLPAWRKQAHRIDIVAIADPNEAARGGRVAQFGIPRAHVSAETMLDEERLDILDICTPCDMHAPLVQLAAGRGVAVLCQKPLAPDLAAARALVDELDPAVPLMVHDNWRYRATYRRIREWLDAGLAGDIRRVQLDYMSSGMIVDASGQRPALVRQPNFRTLPRLLVMEVLTHHLDTLRFLFGELELIAASLSRSNDEVVGEDVATLSIVTRDGRTPVLVAGNLAAHGEPPQARDQLRIYGSQSTITLDGYRLICTGAREIREEFDPDTTYQGAYDTAIARFLDGLDGGAPFETSPSDNLRTLTLVEAAYALGQIHHRS